MIAVEISLVETLPVRSIALRRGLPLSECYIPEDTLDNSFHIGIKVEGEVVGVGSFYPVSYQDEAGGYQLRLMGVMPEWKGKGVGRRVLELGVARVKGSGAKYLWCHAREIAYPFYEKMGFRYISEPFDIPIIGVHRTMRMGW